jgi:hypothetical protein
MTTPVCQERLNYLLSGVFFEAIDPTLEEWWKWLSWPEVRKSYTHYKSENKEKRTKKTTKRTLNNDLFSIGPEKR